MLKYDLKNYYVKTKIIRDNTNYSLGKREIMSTLDGGIESYQLAVFLHIHFSIRPPSWEVKWSHQHGKVLKFYAERGYSGFEP